MLASAACASSPPSSDAAKVADVLVAPSAVASATMTESSSASPPGEPLVAKCEAHDRQACEALAAHCFVGQEKEPKWESKACAERERRACDEGAGAYCAKLAIRFTDSTNDVGVPKDEAVAMKLYVRACDLSGDMDACLRVAFAYDSGFGGLPKDPARAVPLFEGLCDEESGIFPVACQALARHLITGDGVAKDPARGADIHSATCSQGACDVEALDALCSDANRKAKTTAGCLARARVYTLAVAGAPEPNYKKAKDLFERACKRSEAAACRTLADWYSEGKEWHEGTKVPRDPKRAASFLAQACKAGDKTACSTR